MSQNVVLLSNICCGMVSPQSSRTVVVWVTIVSPGWAVQMTPRTSATRSTTSLYRSWRALRFVRVLGQGWRVL
ncbi:hypothetical protein BKA57DRAFT_469690 [Linnemannia elongata]|nr:hypothetical protein BKA57DRAFT_480216 [Linnemannia elongata]KAH7026965.1 hypothetical protein BKA57DRAFT_479989 [Linnemannia elongata]KAH7028233.1 hypothetical protein BKA57DRAFT_479712 [Linnemannia elongata]KAH7032106.1 hypothetical protein BKA57DRAFT_478165 [Linnemannia elongata]KAH7036148.1 hypothetical protein BKA57DRAFT_475641 [Linnemannia elongata]